MIVTHKLLDCNELIVTHKLLDSNELIVKVLANEDVLVPMMVVGLRKLGNICCGHKMFLNKIRNIFCVLDTNFVSATNVPRTGKRGNICVGNNVSVTMCPRLPVP